MLYPLKFEPIFKQKIWGGSKIKELFKDQKNCTHHCGEVWMISGETNNPSIVANGSLQGNELNELIEVFMGDLVGEDVFEKYGSEFPLLFKYIDAGDWLSVQVHPDDLMAAKYGMKNGKSEMWYALQADDNALLINGFNQDMDAENFTAHINNGSIKNVLNVNRVQAGDAFDIPAGRIHAIGPGCLLAEIQQTSDTTYRVYDWNRPGLDGKLRELQTNLALEALNFQKTKNSKTKFVKTANKTHSIVSNDYFSVRYLHLLQKMHKNYEELDSFVVLMNVSGDVRIDFEGSGYELSYGETILLPAITKQIILNPIEEVKLLEIYIPKT